MRWLKVIFTVFFVCIAGLFVLRYTGRFDKHDTVAPEIKYDTEILELSVSDGEDKLLEGVTAVDDVDGDVTASLVVESISSLNTDGTRTVTYGAFDSANHVGRAYRTLRYTDYVGPRFNLSGALQFEEGNTENIMDYLTAYDSIDGDITKNIKILNGMTEYSMMGYYTVVVAVSNSCNDYEELVLNVNVESPSDEEMLYKPQIGLSQYLIYIRAGEEIDPAGYIASVDSKIEEQVLDSSSVNISSSVNKDVPGTYQVVYTVANARGYIGSTTLIVVVEE